MTQTTNPKRKIIFMGNQVKASVEAIRTYCLILDTRHHLHLFQTLYVPSISQNLISLSRLDSVGYSLKFGNGCFYLFKHNHFIPSHIMYDGFYKFKLDNLFVESPLTLHHNVGTNHGLINESSVYLWHKRLGHISKESIEIWILLILAFV